MCSSDLSTMIATDVENPTMYGNYIVYTKGAVGKVKTVCDVDDLTDTYDIVGTVQELINSVTASEDDTVYYSLAGAQEKEFEDDLSEVVLGSFADSTSLVIKSDDGDYICCEYGSEGLTRVANLGDSDDISILGFTDGKLYYADSSSSGSSNLYYWESGDEATLAAKGISNYSYIYSLKDVYYGVDNSDLYMFEDGGRDRMASDVQGFMLLDSSAIVYLDEDDDLYVINSNGDTTRIDGNVLEYAGNSEKAKHIMGML